MRIAGCGCSLADYLYTGVDFNAPALAPYLSRQSGDGGISPGKLVFLQPFEQYAGKPLPDVLREIVGEREPDGFNVGGPAVVALILAAQILEPHGVQVDFHGLAGADDTARRIMDMIRRTPLDISHYETTERAGSPFTMVFSDPTYQDGHGERAFINNIGAAGLYTPDRIPDNFFDAEILLFGATGLVPGLHDNLTDLMRRGKARGCLNVVTTVYDFRSEKANPGGQWPLGDSQDGWPLVDLFVADHEEALKLAGQQSIEAASQYFIEQGVKAFAITQGPQPVWFYSCGELFAPQPVSQLPVSAEVKLRMEREPESVGDTTGCGDNFAGGMLASLALQLQRGAAPGSLSLPQAVALAVCAGGQACFHLGGIYLEQEPGQITSATEALHEAYVEQVADVVQLKPAALSAEFK